MSRVLEETSDVDWTSASLNLPFLGLGTLGNSGLKNNSLSVNFYTSKYLNEHSSGDAYIYSDRHCYSILTPPI